MASPPLDSAVKPATWISEGPGLAVVDLLEKLVRGRIADDLLVLGIPLELLAAKRLAQKTEMTRGDRTMSRLRRADTGLAGLAAIEEVPMVLT